MGTDEELRDWLRRLEARILVLEARAKAPPEPTPEDP